MSKTSNTSKTYTYRNGKKVYLTKAPDELVVRSSPEELRRKGINNRMEKVSLHSTRVTVPADELDTLMG